MCMTHLPLTYFTLIYPHMLLKCSLRPVAHTHKIKMHELFLSMGSLSGLQSSYFVHAPYKFTHCLAVDSLYPPVRTAVTKALQDGVGLTKLDWIISFQFVCIDLPE